MFRNYIKTAFRSLLKNKGFTAINILGLALGLGACLLIVFYVADELSYDRYNTKSERIFRVNADLKLGENRKDYAVVMPPLAKTIVAEFPYVEDAVRLKNAYTMHVKKGDLNMIENKVAFADPSLFNVFTLPMINGDAKTALAEPNSVVLTESTAKRYFDKTDVVGKTMVINDNQNFKVTGVIKDVPQNSHFNFDFFLSMSTWADSRSNAWLRNDYSTYVLLKDATDAKKLAGSLDGFLLKMSGDQMKSEIGMSYADFEKSGSYFRLNLTSLTDIHLKSKRIGELGVNGTVQYVYIFSAIAIFILLIACINFMNLSTARSSNRAREVGVRKVLGSPRKYLIAQFLSESIMITFFATVIALVAAIAVLPLFNQLAGKDIAITTATLFWLIPVSVLIVLVVGSLAGSYPAFFLSAFQPIDVLKGKLSAGFKGGGLRSFLVVFQFGISVFLIIGTLVIKNQLNYIQTINLGFDRNQVLVIQNAYELNQSTKTFKEELKQLPGVTSATMTGFLPVSVNRRSTSIYFKDATLDQKKSIFPQSWEVDADWIPTLGMKMVEGRNFSKDRLSDSGAVIINEAAAEFLGYKNAFGQTLYNSLGGKVELTNTKKYEVIGVMKDFHFSSLHEKIEPVIIRLAENNGAVSLRVNTKDLPALMSQIKSKWATFSPVQMNFSFMDQDFDASYRSEQQVGTIFIIFTTLAIIIACLGLFGLAAYAAEQRTKEIGIRKVLGADVSAIVAMLSKDFVKLVAISIVVASPLAWYCMNLWLQDFVYRIEVQWWVVAVAGLSAIVIAVATVSFQSLKAALANPVDSLKNE
ncbi:ABC transporter permease [Mucilaginibacter psychrotolerans]|uniref:ABC transporter permease n=1 Tax=Mucilaginibacter psychrotolerans TaxID=1524096 RepID=A0A4Y8SMK3_9SPHI|nr:ABC transporter permease [Mucilaginibacter psychrotolerans]TFF39684.1 ABC transporter permease [Mucilaginibacter psychrotolerans]